MNTLFLSESMLARSFWVELRSSTQSNEAVSQTELIFQHSNLIGKLFPTQTGSISRKSTELLWLMARYFEPKHIAEVGTFIGRSTLALYFGAKESLESMVTCDFSYDSWRPPEGVVASRIRYLGKTPSQVMFRQLASEGRTIDLFLVDGRLSPEDVDLIAQIRTRSSIFIIDDFEGVEKGVVNVLKLREKFPELVLIPPENDVRVGWNDTHCLAVLIPSECLRLTRQQRLPLGLM
jgi:predicted O-methyltransferase YrrM